MKDKRLNITAIVFWGSLWGALEATVGYILHLMSFKIGWMFWYPIAFYFMNKAFKTTKYPTSLLFTATIASAIKLTNLFMPTRIDKVINPAVSIILEALVIFAVIKVFEIKKAKVKYGLPLIFLTNISWKTLYIGYIHLMPPLFLEVSSLTALKPFLGFYLWESLICSLVIFSVMQVYERLVLRTNIIRFKLNLQTYFEKDSRIQIASAITMLVIAVVLQWVF